MKNITCKRKLNSELVKAGMYSVIEVTKEEYEEGMKNAPELYCFEKKYNEVTHIYEGISYRKYVTDELSNEEINLLLRVQQNNNIESSAKDIKTIKKILQFFFILCIISLFVIILGALSNSGSSVQRYY